MSAAENSGPSDIVVTARKRSESVQSIPESIRALSSHDLQRLGADSLETYVGVTPGLQITGTRAATQIVIRGVTTGPVNQDQTEIKETVGIYLDETPIAVQRYNPNLKLFDLDRIEVLRGPQGTLYGAGSMSGAIRMITRKPQADHLEAEVEASAGAITHGGTDYSADAMVNVPLVRDTLALRAVGSYRRDGGYIDNVTRHEDNVNSDDSYSGRIMLRFTPSTRFTLDSTLLMEDTKYHAASTYALEAGRLKTNSIRPELAHSRLTIGSVTGHYDAGFADVTVIGSYLRKKYSYDIEAGSFPSFVTGMHDDMGAVAKNYSNQRIYSGEARLSSKGDSPVRWIAGIFYQHSNNAFGQDVTVPGVDAISGLDSRQFGAQPDQLFFSAIDVREKQLALFGEASVPLGSKLTAMIGGRQFFAWQDAQIEFEGVFSYPQLGLTTFHNSEKGFNPKFNLSYQIDHDHLVYAQAAKGFRLGGTNEPVPQPLCTADLVARGFDSAPTSFASDSLWNYEVGAKTSWFDHMLTVNGSVYRIDWKSPQVTAQLACGFNTFVNAGGLRIYGSELEVALHPSKELTLTAGGSYTDSELTQALSFVNGRAGDHAPYTPKWSYNASADYTRRLNDRFSGFLYLNYQYVGRRNQNFNASDPANVVLPAYGTLNARIGLTAEHWSFELFGQNLTDSLGKLNQRFTPFPFFPATFVTPIKPRTVGLKIRYKI